MEGVGQWRRRDSSRGEVTWGVEGREKRVKEHRLGGQCLSQHRQVALWEALIICAAATGCRRGQRSASWLTGVSASPQLELWMMEKKKGIIIMTLRHIFLWLSPPHNFIGDFIGESACVIWNILKAQCYIHIHIFILNPPKPVERPRTVGKQHV